MGWPDAVSQMATPVAEHVLCHTSHLIFQSQRSPVLVPARLATQACTFTRGRVRHSQLAAAHAWAAVAMPLARVVVAAAAHVCAAPAEPAGHAAAVPARSRQQQDTHAANVGSRVACNSTHVQDSDSLQQKRKQSRPATHASCSCAALLINLCSCNCRVAAGTLTCTSRRQTLCRVKGSCCLLRVQSSCHTPAPGHHTPLHGSQQDTQLAGCVINPLLLLPPEQPYNSHM